jgi:hypothetical protein
MSPQPLRKIVQNRGNELDRDLQETDGETGDENGLRCRYEIQVFQPENMTY